MDINEFFSLAIVGAMNSELLEFITTEYGKKGSVIATLVMSLLVGSAFTFFSDFGWFLNMLGVLTASSTYYALFVKVRK